MMIFRAYDSNQHKKFYSYFYVVITVLLTLAVSENVIADSASDCLDHTNFTKSSTDVLRYDVIGSDTRNTKYRFEQVIKYTPNITTSDGNLSKIQFLELKDGHRISKGKEWHRKLLNNNTFRNYNYAEPNSSGGIINVKKANLIVIYSLMAGEKGKNSSSTTSALFIGKEKITVPAGTFWACKFERDFGNSITYSWYAVKTGWLLKKQESNSPAGRVLISGCTRKGGILSSKEKSKLRKCKLPAHNF